MQRSRTLVRTSREINMHEGIYERKMSKNMQWMLNEMSILHIFTEFMIKFTTTFKFKCNHVNLTITCRKDYPILST